MEHVWEDGLPSLSYVLIIAVRISVHLLSSEDTDGVAAVIAIKTKSTECLYFKIYCRKGQWKIVMSQLTAAEQNEIEIQWVERNCMQWRHRLD